MRICLPFTEAYIAIRTSYEEPINKYVQMIKTEMSYINSSGKAEASLENYKLWVRETHSDTSIGTPVFSAEREIFMPVLESSRYKEITDDFPEIKVR
jgi:hypothetical protein